MKILTFLLLLPVCIYSQGSEVNLLLKNGNSISGRLLYAGEKEIIISTVSGEEEENLDTDETNVKTIPNDSIKNITVLGKSNILAGMGLGTLIGVGVGALFGFGSGDDPPHEFISFSAGEKALMLGTFLGAVGLVIGLISGVITSSRDKVYEPLMNNDFSFLKRYALYEIKPVLNNSSGNNLNKK